MWGELFGAVREGLEKVPDADPDAARAKRLRRWAARWWNVARRYVDAKEDGRDKAKTRLAGVLLSMELALEHLGVSMDEIAAEFAAEMEDPYRDLDSAEDTRQGR